MGELGNKKVIEAKKKYLGETEDSVSSIVAYASLLKLEFDSLEKELGKYKSFFKAIGDPGDVFYGDDFSVKLTGSAVSTVEPGKLQTLLQELGRAPEFLGLVGVKVADARKKLGTVLFEEIADTVPNAKIAVKFGKK